jgi:hypothetical protein
MGSISHAELHRRTPKREGIELGIILARKIRALSYINNYIPGLGNDSGRQRMSGSDQLHYSDHGPATSGPPKETDEFIWQPNDRMGLR